MYFIKIRKSCYKLFLTQNCTCEVCNKSGDNGIIGFCYFQQKKYKHFKKFRSLVFGFMQFTYVK